MITGRASGFIYAVARTGVTGTSEDAGQSAEILVARVREVSNLPVAVGFGISNAAQVAEVWRYADAAVVGSAIVAEIERLFPSPDLPTAIGEFARHLLGQ
jgi:tryptophan synthase alpha chain